MPTKSNINVSVIIPTHNRAILLMRAVRSVLAQTYQSFEIIVVDDASNDETETLISKLQKKNPNIRFLKNKIQLGAQRSRNVGIEAANGKYVAFLDSDNEWLPKKLEKQVSLLYVSSVKPGLVYCGFIWKHESGEPQRVQVPYMRGNIEKAALKEWVADTSTLLVDKNLCIQTGMFDPAIRAYQEWDFCIRIAQKACFDYVQEPLAIYHLHSGASISKDFLLSAQGYLDVINKYRSVIVKKTGRKILSSHYRQSAGIYAQAGNLWGKKYMQLKASFYHPEHFLGYLLKRVLSRLLFLLPNRVREKLKIWYLHLKPS